MEKWIDLYKSGNTLCEIAESYKCSVGKVRNFLIKNNVSMRLPGQQYAMPDKEIFKEDCKKMRWYQLEEKYKISWSIIKYWKRQYGLTDGKKHNREIFWKKTKDGCHKCLSHKLLKGYPRSKNNLIGKIMWMNKNGEWPDKMIMRHMCGNKWCINPEHIKPGTQWENNIDTLLSGMILMHRCNSVSMIKKAIGECMIKISKNKIIRLEDGKSFDMPSYMIEGGEHYGSFVSNS